MAAPEGNSNAEKWTFEKSQEFLNGVFEYVRDNEDCASLSEACSQCGQYEDLFKYLQKKFNDIDFHSIKKAKEILKERIIKKGLTNEYNATMSIFVLKNNHDMNDKTQVEHSGGLKGFMPEGFEEE